MIGVGTAALLLAAGVSMLRSRAFPKWLAWIAIVLGVLSVTPAGFFVFLAYGIWVLLASIVMLRGSEAASPAA